MFINLSRGMYGGRYRLCEYLSDPLVRSNLNTNPNLNVHEREMRVCAVTICVSVRVYPDRLVTSLAKDYSSEVHRQLIDDLLSPINIV